MASLLACSPAPAPLVESFTPTPIYPAQSIGPVTGGISALAFAPNATIPWEGRILIAPKTGGIIAYSIEGVAGNQVDGPIYTSMATHPGFSLRGLKTGFVLAVTADGTLVSMIIDDARGQIFTAPVAGLPMSGANGVCALDALPGRPKFAIARQDGSFEQWQIEDLGSDLLQAKLLGSGQLLAPAKACSSANGKVFATSASGGMFVIDISDQPVIERGIDTLQDNLVAIALDDQITYILGSSTAFAPLNQYDQQLTQTGTLSAVAGLSNPPVEQPGALAITHWSYGGAGFSAGLLGIADDANDRVSLIVRDTLPGFINDQELR